ncbi:E3 ubiquitin/ISG15 ligase TRIM25-like isoform X2 [Brachyhypopomus gauderio]|uniref:E3 ubiquitin/ISG15 ligase TRIM25-like isoform X2 n=1 Tax=Brachyhypopomus gauderio TaxID=698409 RepID=UPI00404188E1
MAEAHVPVDTEHICCAICLDTLNVPVSIPCGHTYCRNCIQDFWDQGHQRRSSCPQCRRSFDVRPELNPNTVLADLVEKLRKTELRKTPPTDGVWCDVCRENTLPAVRSCLVCLASYCELHVQPHFESPAFKKHTLVAPCKALQEKLCPAHGRLYEFYCRTDQVCVCCLCAMGEHGGHEVVTAETARVEQGEALARLGRVLNENIQQREKVSQDLRKAVKNIKCSAQEARGDVERTLTELIDSIKRRHSEVMELLQAQEETELRSVEDLLERVELQIAELRETSAEVERTLETSDHIDFLQSYLCLKHLSVPQTFDDPNPKHKVTFKKVVQFVSVLQKILGDICDTDMTNILETKPQTREDFLHYSCYLTLESAPDHPSLCVCEDGRSVEWVAHSSSGSVWPQVLCREGLTGRCYWEAQWGGTGICTVGLIEGRDDRGAVLKTGFGRDTHSWGMDLFHLSYVFRHGDDNVTVATPEASNTIGVYLDHRAGMLSFYSVSDKMTLLHRARACFSRPLYPGFALWVNAWQSFFGKPPLISRTGHMFVKLINL